MTAAIALKPGDSIGRCREEMDRAGLRDMTVVDAGNRVVGIVSTGDLELAMRRGLGLVADIMEPVVPVALTSSVLEALDQMISENLGLLPVVGPDDELVGVLTETAFLSVARVALTSSPAVAPQRRSRRDDGRSSRIG